MSHAARSMVVPWNSSSGIPSPAPSVAYPTVASPRAIVAMAGDGSRTPLVTDLRNERHPEEERDVTSAQGERIRVQRVGVEQPLEERRVREVAEQRAVAGRSEEHTSELQSHSDLVCRLLLEKKKKRKKVPELTN